MRSLNEYLAWRIGAISGYVTLMQRSEHDAMQRIAVDYAAELHALRRLSAALQSGGDLSPVLVVWRDYIAECAITYQRSPYRYEAQNKVEREAARQKRDARLAALKGKAA